MRPVGVKGEGGSAVESTQRASRGRSDGARCQPVDMPVHGKARTPRNVKHELQQGGFLCESCLD